jgi:hypothetical protein
MWFLLTLAWSLNGEVCHSDFFDESRMDQEKVCHQTQSRGIASTTDQVTEFEDRLIDFIQKKQKTLDLDGDGKPDVFRKPMANGQTEILYYKKQKLYQRVVFNKANEVVLENTDADLDGAFDQTYKCSGDTCLQKLQIKNGREAYQIRTKRVKDQITETYLARSGNGWIKKAEKSYKNPKGYFKYEDELEKLKQEEPARVERYFAETEGAHNLCWDCYKRDYNAFTKLLETYKAIKKPRRLRRIGDFIVSRVGVLIHKSCEEKYGREYDVEEQVTQAVVKGMSCFTDFLEKKAPWEKATSDAIFGKSRVLAYGNHIPRALNLFTTTFNWDPETYECKDVLEDEYYTSRGAKAPCVDYKTPDYMKPKVICENLVDAEELGARGAYGYASGGGDTGSGVFVSGNKTVVLPHPFVSVMDDGEGRNKYDKTNFQSIVWHELMHNMGYKGGDHPEHQMIHHCENDCFKNAGARGQCFMNKPYEEFYKEYF